MAYISFDYYKNNYIGQFVDEADFAQYEKRAADVVDSVTAYQVKLKGLDSFDAFAKEQIMNAVAAQVELYVIRGICMATDGVAESSFTVGKVSVSTGNTAKIISPKVYEYLEPTGLLYRGV